MSDNDGSIFQKIDPWISDDPDIAAAGALAEFLYIRGLLYMRRQRRDGWIPKVAFKEIADGIPAAQKHAASLVAHGLWIDDGTKWVVRNWAGTWNQDKEERDTRSKAKATAGVKGAHSKWHTAEAPKKGCEFCENEGWA